ncbi:hypothetical protein [Amycolatopsis saalfeldensis]|uniref:Uncharacterized protein n=1 Tax=Amycolatopsis saalfeldensis TaxID=394193 RepID=A0A1H8XKY0_9PSEU|nr:hypothetical protein [Amycolatopsis saalfeldensis]SEP40744.1 hypothetical protein SAMN04489732_10838 [Amycolatopsis saalfeldensis]
MNEEVSVADLLVREGWGERVPPPSRSRWRMVAVMLAVVVGCGAAAVLVGFGTTANDTAAHVTEMKVIEMPDRTGGAGGVSETNPPTVGGTSGGEGQQSSPGDGTSDQPRSSDVTSTLDPLNPRGGSTHDSPPPRDSAPPQHSDSSTPTGDPSSPDPSTSAQPPTHSSTPKPPPPPCLLGILFC